MFGPVETAELKVFIIMLTCTKTKIEPEEVQNENPGKMIEKNIFPTISNDTSSASFFAANDEILTIYVVLSVKQIERHVRIFPVA